MHILRQTAILWDNSLGLKSSCKVNLALPPLPKAHLPLLFLSEFTGAIFPLYFLSSDAEQTTKKLTLAGALGQLCWQLDDN